MEGYLDRTESTQSEHIVLNMNKLQQGVKGFLQGLTLSSQHHTWSQHGNTNVSFHKTLSLKTPIKKIKKLINK